MEVAPDVDWGGPAGLLVLLEPLRRGAVLAFGLDLAGCFLR